MLFIQMMMNIKENQLMINGMDKELINLYLEIVMKENGKIIRNMEKGNYTIKMVNYIQVIGQRIKNVVRECIFISMVIDMQENGKMIKEMEWG